MKKNIYYSVLITTLAIFGLSNSANAQTIGGGPNHSLALCSNGTVSSWGRNLYGQLGNGTSNNSSYVPSPVSLLTGVIAVAGGQFHSLALKSDGTVWAWGSNYSGQLGNGTNLESLVPVQISSLTGVIAISSGEEHSLALKNDGTVWAWGENLDSQLGNGGTNSNDSNIPVQVSALTGVIAIAAGSNTTIALKNDGTVWSWGAGYLGNGTYSFSSVPVQVTGLSGIITIAQGRQHSFAHKNDGTVWAWGRNDNSQLGDGTSVNRTAPVLINSLTSITAIEGGWMFTIALKNDGTVWAWGEGLYGQLGNGNNTNTSLPVQVSFLTGITAISGQDRHSLALQNDGTVWAWGQNPYGEIGNGTNALSNVPVQVAGLCNGALAIKKNSMDNLVSVYPNPSNDLLIIEGEFEEEINITLTDITGKLVFKQTENGMDKKYVLNTEVLTNGMYLLRIQGATQQAIKKVSISH